jgi:hypothetical protein
VNVKRDEPTGKDAAPESRRDSIKLGSATTLGVLTGGLSTTLADEVANPASAKRTYDCIVLGPGAMGSACIYQLAKRGASVLGLEQFDIAHVLGSSGGISRQTKVATYLGGPHGPLIRSPIQPLGRKPRPKRGVSAETL